MRGSPSCLLGTARSFRTTARGSKAILRGQLLCCSCRNGAAGAAVRDDHYVEQFTLRGAHLYNSFVQKMFAVQFERLEREVRGAVQRITTNMQQQLAQLHRDRVSEITEVRVMSRARGVGTTLTKAAALPANTDTSEWQVVENEDGTFYFNVGPTARACSPLRSSHCVARELASCGQCRRRVLLQHTHKTNDVERPTQLNGPPPDLPNAFYISQMNLAYRGKKNVFAIWRF